MPKEDNEKTLHGLLKGKIIYRIEENERKIESLPKKVTNNGFMDPRDVIKGKFSYIINEKSAKKS